MSRFFWLIRREIWEHKVIWVAPLIVLACLLLLVLIGEAHFGPIGSVDSGALDAEFPRDLQTQWLLFACTRRAGKRHRDTLRVVAKRDSDRDCLLSPACHAVLAVKALRCSLRSSTRRVGCAEPMTAPLPRDLSESRAIPPGTRRDTMNLLTNTERDQLLANGRAQREAIRSGRDDASPLDPHPVVKLFTPDASATWLLTELDPDDHDLGFGLCDLGLGCPELGYVRLSEIEALRGPMGLPVERDQHFDADRRISTYAADARQAGRIRT